MPPPPVGQADDERRPGRLHVVVVPPAGRSSFLPPTPPRAPPSQVDFYDPSLLKDGGSSIAQHGSQTSLLLPFEVLDLDLLHDFPVEGVWESPLSCRN